MNTKDSDKINKIINAFSRQKYSLYQQGYWKVYAIIGAKVYNIMRNYANSVIETSLDSTIYFMGVKVIGISLIDENLISLTPFMESIDDNDENI